MGGILYRFWRVLRWVLLALVALLLAFVIAALWVNRHDDPLLAEVAAALRFEPPAAEAMRRNGYFTMLGLGAPADEDPVAAGQRFVAAQTQGYELYLRTGQMKSFAGEAWPHQPIEMRPMRCDGEVDDCYAHYLEHADAILAALATNAPLVQRYLSLLDAPEYEEFIPPYIGVEFPHYTDLVAASELVGMRAALLLEAHRLDEGLALLARNAEIHRRLMAGSHSLIGAMIALAADLRQQRLIGSLPNHLPVLASRHAEQMTGLLESTPVTLEAALKSEMAMQLNGFNPWLLKPTDVEFRTDEDWEPAKSLLVGRALDLLYLPNVSRNSLYRRWQETIRLASLPADQLLPPAMQPADAEADAPGSFALRNAVGWYFLDLTTPDWQAYIERAHDSEGHRRLLRLQIAAVHAGVRPAKMTGWLAAQPPELRDPYTLQPMGWDAAAQTLVFTGRQPQNQNPQRTNIYRVRLALPAS